MNKDTFRTALLYSLLAGILILADLLIDQVLDHTNANVTELSLSHLIFAVVVVFSAFFLLRRAIETRRQAETVLRQARDELEIRVKERTIELEAANIALQTEITERQQAERERERLLAQVEEARQRAENLANELKLANSILLALIETLPAGMVVTDSDGGVVLVNRTARALLGNALKGASISWTGDPIILRRDGSLVKPEEMPLTHAIQRGETTTGLEVLIRREEGSMTPVLMAASPVRDEVRKHYQRSGDLAGYYRSQANGARFARK